MPVDVHHQLMCDKKLLCAFVILGAIACSGPSDGEIAPELTMLRVSTVRAMEPSFAPSTFSYSLALPVMATEIRLSPTALDPEATIMVNGVETTSGQWSGGITLPTGVTTAMVEVTASSGKSQTYAVDLTRAESSSTVAQMAYGKASNTDENDNFGRAVAVFGDTLVVTALGEASNATGVNGDEGNNEESTSGAVYVYRHDGSSWKQEAYLKAFAAEAPIYNFGTSLDIFGDTIAVGAPFENAGASSSGAVFIFRRTEEGWAQEAYLKASNAGAGDQFGISVSLAGESLAIGARFEASGAVGIDGDQDDDMYSEAGAVYVFDRTGTTWTQTAYIKASNTDAGDQFGEAVSLYGDTLAVSATNEASILDDPEDNSLDACGAVYVFRRQEGAWTQEQFLKASNAGIADSFGNTLSLSGDTLAVAAWVEDSDGRGISVGGADNNDAGESGAVYLYERSGDTWTEAAFIKASNADEGDTFGFSLDLDGTTLAVSALSESSGAKGVDGDESDNALQSGATYVFLREGDTWEQHRYIKASNTEYGDGFGYGVGLSGGMLAVGADGEASSATGLDGDQEDNAAEGSGAFYLYE